jgi:hypothetical protein
LDDDAPTAARAIHLDLPWDHPDNRPALQTVLRGYQHPAIPAKVNAAGYALSHYAANARVLGGTRPMSRGEILDGPVNTILIGEINEHFKPWGHPANWRDPALGLKGHPHGFGSPTGPDVRFLMSDGSVRVLKQDTDPKVLRALSTPNGGEPINAAELP